MTQQAVGRAGSRAVGRAGGRDVRLVAVNLMCRLDRNRGSLTTLLPDALADVAPDDRPHLQSLAFGLARWSVQGTALVKRLLAKPMKAKDADLVWLLKLGLFQLLHTRMPAHAAVDETVKVTGKLKKPWARGLVNGVLRNFQRNQAQLLDSLAESEQYSHPQWLLDRFKQDWPQQWQAIADANNQQAPMSLRVNSSRGSRADWIDQLAEHEPDVLAAPSVQAVDAVIITPALPVQRLPGFDQGLVSVQDVAAQISVDLLEVSGKRGGRLLDACAAPGGKTAHALERDLFDEVLALDNDELRLDRVRQTLNRLQFTSSATLLHADASEPERWWDGTPFQAILLDAPCSGTGVIRRHPDIKQLRRPDDIDALVQLQSRMLAELWPLLAPGGVLLYCTCSILKAENEMQVQAFLKTVDDADVVLPDVFMPDVVMPDVVLPEGDRASWGEAAYPESSWGQMRPESNAVGRQIFPGQQGMDGFFHARIVKKVEHAA